MIFDIYIFIFILKNIRENVMSNRFSVLSNNINEYKNVYGEDPNNNPNFFKKVSFPSNNKMATAYASNKSSSCFISSNTINDTNYAKMKTGYSSTSQNDNRKSCVYGSFCRNFECYYWHPPDRKLPFPKKDIHCKYGNQCNISNCPYKHQLYTSSFKN